MRTQKERAILCDTRTRMMGLHNPPPPPSLPFRLATASQVAALPENSPLPSRHQHSIENFKLAVTCFEREKVRDLDTKRERQRWREGGREEAGKA